MRAPSAPPPRRPAQAALAQSAVSQIEIPESLAGEGRDPIHLAEAARMKSSANPRALFGFPRKGFVEMLRRVRKSAVLLRRTGKKRLVLWRDRCGDPSSRESLFEG